MIVFQPDSWNLGGSVAVFLACTLTIGIAGTLITKVVDQLADRTGLGEAVSGAVLLGASTSLSGAVVSVTAGWNGYAELAVSNAIGGIAVQTAFLAVADIAYRRANLEHAAAEPANMMQNGLLIALLSLILLGPLLPDTTILGVHPITPLLFVLYIYGIRLVRAVRAKPMWVPTQTSETREDKPEPDSRLPALSLLWGRYLSLMIVLVLSGWAMSHAATNIVDDTVLSATVVGALLTAVCTSLPELVTSVVAVRRGALALAVGGIIGGNAFDTLFTAAADISYRDGSVYHAMTESTQRWVVLTLLMSAVLIMGLVRRERQGIGRIGMESFTILILYVAGIVLLFI